MKKIYVIEWQDAVSQTGWDELDSELPMICYTVGVIVLEFVLLQAGQKKTIL